MSLQSPRQARSTLWGVWVPRAPAVGGYARKCMAVLFIGGCALGPGPKAAFSPNAHELAPIDLRPFLISEYSGGKRYTRYPSAASPAAGQSYRRVATDAGRAEGSLRSFQGKSLSDFLDPHSDRPGRPRAPWPTSPTRNAAGFFVEFEPSLVEWPDHIAMGVSYTSAARLEAFDGAGIPFVTGSARRSVWLVGRESVEVDGKQYSSCLRLGSATHLRFGWWASVRIDEAVWFARSVGVVRRKQAIRGTALFLFPFASTYVYDLQYDWSTVAEPSPIDQITSIEWLTNWKRLAIHLDRIFPRPRVGGLAVECEFRPSAAEQLHIPPTSGKR